MGLESLRRQETWSADPHVAGRFWLPSRWAPLSCWRPRPGRSPRAAMARSTLRRDSSWAGCMLNADDAGLYRRAVVEYREYLRLAPRGELVSAARQNIAAIEVRL